MNLTIYAEEELEGKSLEELKSIVEQFKAKLNLTGFLFLTGLKEAQKDIFSMFAECEQESEINHF